MEQLPSQRSNVMGVVRCAQQKGKGRTSFVIYKKRFWVVDEFQGRLEMYKNDQEPVPQSTFLASDVSGVIFSRSKRNKFYALVLLLRRARNIRFLLSSSAERDRWCTAITRLIERHSIYNCVQNVLRVAQQRTLLAERLLRVSITLAIARLSDIPDHLLQYLVEAVDVAIDTISSVVQKYGSDIDIPRRYTITVVSAGMQTCIEPRYDPTTRSLVMQVGIYRDSMGDVGFRVVGSSEILKIIQSHVWRDPRIEGWITTNPECVAVTREIGSMLGIKRSFFFSFQWGKNVKDTSHVESYLRRHVHVDFLRDVQRQILEVVEDFRSSEGLSNGSKYKKYISDYVSGIAITLDEKSVNADRPPELFVTTTSEYQRRCRHAVMIISKYLEAYREPNIMTESLRDQLVMVILLADLCKRISDSKAMIAKKGGGKARVKIMWNNLLCCSAGVGAPLHLRNLSQLVTSCSNIYLGRLQSLQQLLDDVKPSTEDDKSLFGTIFKNVISVVVDFVPFIRGRSETLPDPKIEQGILTDYILCSLGSDQTALMDFIRRRRILPQTSKAFAVACQLCIFPSMPVAMLKGWCEKYLRDIPVKCDYADDDNSSSLSAAHSEDLGDAVAYERSAETQVLDMHRVVSTIYDSQGASVKLKIGADAIRLAINALEQAFGGRRIRKHDLVRVFISNLERLRVMYSHAVGDDSVGFLNLQSAANLLCELCEYEQNTSDVEYLLQRCVQERRHKLARLLTEPFAENGKGNVSGDLSGYIYDFQCVSEVAINYLLPREAKLARLAWRVGFMAGLENVGKSLIINCLKGLVQSTIPTVGLSRQAVTFEEWVFSLNELGGRESFRENWCYYVKQMETVDFLFFVVDSMNRRTFKDAAAYLRAITDYFTTIPLVVVFNNYSPGSSGTPSVNYLETAVKLDVVRQRRPQRSVFVGTCDITMVSSSHRTVPLTLLLPLNGLSMYLRDVSPPDRKAVHPKSGGPSDAVAMKLL